MPATLAATPQATKPQAKQPQIVVPFSRAAVEHIEPFMDVTSAQLSANSQLLAPVDVPAYGFIRGIWLEVTASGGTGAAAVYKLDGPFTAVTDVQVMDVNGAPIFGPYDGYDVNAVDKLGGYRRSINPKQHPDYTAPSTGNFSFLLYIPLEVNGRDALGSLANLNAASSYKLKVTVAPSTNTFSTPPTTLPVVRVRAWLDAWTQPAGQDLRGNAQATQPPAHGTTGFWSKQIVNVNAGQQTIRLQRVGNLIRNLIFVYRDVSGVRNKTNFAPAFDIYWDTRLLKEFAPITWRGIMAERYNLTGADDTANGLETGVYVDDYCHEFDGQAGFEMRDGWLVTGQSTRMDVIGNFGAAGTLTILTNDVSPAGEVFV